MTTSGTAITQLTTDPDQDALPQMSPDGSLILFYSTRDDPSGDVYTMNANGTEITRLTVVTGQDLWGRWFPQS
jgi:Tol biopolymer transport system component